MQKNLQRMSGIAANLEMHVVNTLIALRYLMSKLKTEN